MALNISDAHTHTHTHAHPSSGISNLKSQITTQATEPQQRPVTHSFIDSLLELMQQVAGEGGAGPAVLVEAGSGGGLEAEDAVLAGDVASDGDAALAGVDGGGAAAGRGDGAATHVVDGRLRRLRVLVQPPRQRRPSVPLHLVRRRAVSSVEPRVSPQELVVRPVRLVPRAPRQRVRHCECAGHD